MIKIIMTILFGIPAMMVLATQNQGNMQWKGVVGGAFNSNNITLKAEEGYVFNKNILNIEEDGTFNLQKPIVIKAQTMTETVQGSGIYDLVSDDSYNGDIIWKLSDVYISHPAYDASKIRFKANGLDFNNEAGIETKVNEHALILTSYLLSNGIKNTIKPKDSVQMTATIIIETKI